MKKLLSILIVAVTLMPLVSKAQSTTTNGPELELDENASAYVLDDNDDFILFFSQKRTWSYDDVVITKYNKQTLGITEQAVDDDYEGRFVFLTDDNTVVNVVRFVENKKSLLVEYQKASFPLDVKVPKKLVFTTFFSIPLTNPHTNKKESFYTRACFNADKSKFAIVSTSNMGKNQFQSIIDVAVFDNTANLLYHESKVIDRISHSPFEDISVSLDGTVYIVWSESDNVYRSYENENGLQIITCSEHGVFDYKENPEVKDAYITHKQILKSNNDLCLMCIWGRNGNSECKLRTYTVTSAGEVDFVEEDITMSADYEGKKYDDGEFAKQKGNFKPYIFDMIKLQDGKFMIVAELKKIVQVGVRGNNGFPISGMLSHNFFCIKVDASGRLLEMNVYPRATLTREYYANWDKSNPIYAFEWDGDTYLIYNDNRANYKNNGIIHCLLYNRPDQCSVVLSKVENNNELSSTILYDAQTNLRDPRAIAAQFNHEYFLKLLHQADDGIYYILKHDGEYRLEKITVE